MIVTNQSTVEDNRQQEQGTREASRSSDRFQRLLDGHQREQSDADEQARRVAKQGALKGREAEILRPEPGAAASAGRSGPQGAGVEVPGAASAPQSPAGIRRLAEELGQQIELHPPVGPAGALEITFHSRSLAGLEVSIRRVKGELAIQLKSPSPRMGRLLRLHAPGLQESLEARGLRIRKIDVAGGPAGAAPSGRRDAEG